MTDGTATAADDLDLLVDGNALPPLSTEERDRLKADIAANGVRIPVEVCAETGIVLDGHHRLEIARELDIDCPTVGIDGLDNAAERVAYQLRVNLLRRQLSPDQVTEVRARQKAAAFHLRQQGMSQHDAALAVGVAQQTISDWEGGTSNTGSGNSCIDVRVKLGKEAKAEIVDRVEAGEPQTLVAADYKVTQQHVSNVVAAARRERERADTDGLELDAEEQQLLDRNNDGETIVVNFRTHQNLIAVLNRRDRLVKIDRTGPWGNPFIVGDDGDRQTVIANYRDHYLPHKPSLLGRLNELEGKALACWCAPEPCHGDILKEAADR